MANPETEATAAKLVKQIVGASGNLPGHYAVIIKVTVDQDGDPLYTWDWYWKSLAADTGQK